MRKRRSDCEIEEFKIWRDSVEQDEGWLIDAAFRDILAGKFDTEAVHLAMKLGHREEYSKLKEAHDEAIRAARHAGAL